MVIGGHICEEGYADCKDFDDYTTRLVSKIDEDPGNRGRPVFVVAHGAGALPAWGVARKLGRRCLKLYVLGSRAPNHALLDEVFNVHSAPELHAMDDHTILASMIEAWPCAVLEDIKGEATAPELSQRLLAVAKLVKQLYGS